MSKKPTALRRLLNRTLGYRKKSDVASVSRHKLSKAEKKARQRRRNEIKQRRAYANEDLQAEETRMQNAERLSQLRALTAEQQAELERIQSGIADDLIESVTLAKERLHQDRQEESDSEDDLPADWRGLPPGLAPVGYDPDSSDDEPY